MTILFIIFLIVSSNNIVDRYVAVVGDEAFTLYELKLDCIFSELLKGDKSTVGKKCLTDDIKHHLNNFLNKKIVLKSTGIQLSGAIKDEVDKVISTIMGKFITRDEWIDFMRLYEFDEKTLKDWVIEMVNIVKYIDMRYGNLQDELYKFIEEMRLKLRTQVFF